MGHFSENRYEIPLFRELVIIYSFCPLVETQLSRAFSGKSSQDKLPQSTISPKMWTRMLPLLQSNGERGRESAIPKPFSYGACISLWMSIEKSRDRSEAESQVVTHPRSRCWYFGGGRFASPGIFSYTLPYVLMNVLEVGISYSGGGEGAQQAPF